MLIVNFLILQEHFSRRHTSNGIPLNCSTKSPRKFDYLSASSILATLAVATRYFHVVQLIGLVYALFWGGGVLDGWRGPGYLYIAHNEADLAPNMASQSYKLHLASWR